MNCSFDEDLVCGDDEIEYRNECWLKYNACANRVDIKVKYKGPCRGNATRLEDKGEKKESLYNYQQSNLERGSNAAWKKPSS